MFATYRTADACVRLLPLMLGIVTTPALATEEDLRDTVRLLKERVQVVEEAVATQASNSRRSFDISFSGRVEVEAGFTEDYDGNSGSDLNVATVEVGIDASTTDWSNIHILLLHEEDETDLEIDEAVLTFANPDVSPVFAAAGRMYVPFGNFESHLVSDPLTLELGETRESALQVGFEQAGAYGSIYAFNGDIEKAGADDRIGHYGANLGFAMEGDSLELDAGISYLSSIADSDGLQSVLEGVTLTDHVSGGGAYAVLHTGPFSLIGEYVTAADRFAAGEIDFKGTGAKPAAWNLEAAYRFQLAGREATFAAAYQGTKEALGLELPETRYLAALSVGILEHTSLSLELARDQDYGTDEGGTGSEADTVTLQLAAEF